MGCGNQVGAGTCFLDGLWRSARQEPTRLKDTKTDPPMLVECPDYRTSVWPWSGGVALGQFGSVLRVPHGCGDVPAAVGKQVCCGFADARTGTGDEN